MRGGERRKERKHPTGRCDKNQRTEKIPKSFQWYSLGLPIHGFDPKQHACALPHLKKNIKYLTNYSKYSHLLMKEICLNFVVYLATE